MRLTGSDPTTAIVSPPIRVVLNIPAAMPARSTRRAAMFRDSGRSRVSGSRHAATTACAANTERRPNASTSTPASVAPNARPSPTTVPKTPKARARAGPSYASAISALPLVIVAAAPAPASARARSSSTMFPDTAPGTDAPQNSATPNVRIRRRPNRSASEPNTSIRLPTADREALASGGPAT